MHEVRVSTSCALCHGSLAAALQKKMPRKGDTKNWLADFLKQEGIEKLADEMPGTDAQHIANKSKCVLPLLLRIPQLLLLLLLLLLFSGFAACLSELSFLQVKPFLFGFSHPISIFMPFAKVSEPSGLGRSR